MAEWVLKYADTRGEIHQQTASAVSEQELRERYSQQGFLIYSVRPRRTGLAAAGNIMGRSKKLNLERFLIFNQQFVTLVRAGLPILKALDLLADRLTDVNLGAHVKAVRGRGREWLLLAVPDHLPPVVAIPLTRNRWPNKNTRKSGIKVTTDMANIAPQLLPAVASKKERKATGTV